MLSCKSPRTLDRIIPSFCFVQNRKLKKPNETKSAKKYFNTELKKLKRFFDNNLEFYKYYLTNNTFIDNQLFVRGKYDIKLNLDTIYFETDHSFSTIADYKVAKILANDLIQVYLEDQLNNLNSG